MSRWERILGLWLLAGLALAQGAWQAAASPHAILEYQSPATSQYLAESFQIIEGALAEYAPLLGIAVADPVTLRAYPDLASYQAATGQPWWIAAYTDPAGLVHLQRLGALVSRGILRRTLRHELVHALLRQAPGTLPRWLEEGIAGLLAGEASEAGTVPSDEELVSPDAPVRLSAYRRAIGAARALLATEGWEGIRARLGTG